MEEDKKRTKVHVIQKCHDLGEAGAHTPLLACIQNKNQLGEDKCLFGLCFSVETFRVPLTLIFCLLGVKKLPSQDQQV